ncbi:hypothetical protein V2A60_009203 [Cordyceps javanica]|uniref:ATPase synthesis protein 25 n=1 Tax=Cordyceps javanica TaxID=43265 RepID=A0A545UTE3_9HYPO|nr:Mitochondrial protein required for the stability of Oli1p mRNA and for the Oli1p ring formation [Cordyceps javanica]TQW03301.1 Mitochondrial protein required for the stability of Oli1p mRNA and for the Oli1p ring formation [Cordyceps javanica]
MLYLQPRLSSSLHVQQRNLSTTTIRRLRVEENTHKASGDELTQAESPEEDTPWFLEEELPRLAPSHHQQTLPVAPEGAPAVIDPMMKYIFEDMGLDDLALFDLRELDPHAALGPNLIMVFGTARSEKHLHVSAGRFVRWIRKHHQFEAKADGLIGAGELRTKLRRLRKKAKLMGTNANIIPRGDNGISTGWICVSFNTDDGVSTVDANFDATGRMAGFDAGAASTTIVVQCMTEARRQELDLETLWEGMLKRSIRDSRQIDGKEPLSADELKDQVASRLQLPEGYNKAAKQWQAMEDASQKRYFSTSARRLAAESSPKNAQTTTHLNLDSVATHVRDFQASGAPMDAEDLVRLIRHVFQAGPQGPDTAAERIRLVDQLLLAGEERGISLLSGDILITLIESMATSPAYGPALQRAQANMEFLLSERRIAPSGEQSRRLMAAYAQRQDWERFWDAFRAPARFRQARDAALYELAYAAVTATRDAALCTDALRWLYPEMGREDPPVLPTGALYDALRACILIADPAAEELLRSPPPEAGMTTLEKRSLKHREFVVMLRDIERIRGELRTEEARLERHQAMETEIRSRFEA